MLLDVRAPQICDSRDSARLLRQRHRHFFPSPGRIIDLLEAFDQAPPRTPLARHLHKEHTTPLPIFTMATRTAAQEEFDSIVSKASSSSRLNHHPSDTHDSRHDRPTGEQDEETEYVQKRVDENMRMPSLDPRGGLFHLPHRDFDSGRTTGVKGVIADARSYEEARRTGSYRGSRTNSSTRNDKRASTATFLNDDGEGSASEEEEFIERWRQQRRQELSTIGSDIRNRRTSPSVRRYGRFDEVDALGYLDAIEKVTRDTIVVVFVYDHEVTIPPP